MQGIAHRKLLIIAGTIAQQLNVIDVTKLDTLHVTVLLNHARNVISVVKQDILPDFALMKWHDIILCMNTNPSTFF